MGINKIQEAFMDAAREVFGYDLKPEHLFFENQLTDVGRYLTYFIYKECQIKVPCVELKITKKQCPEHIWPHIKEYIFKTCKDSVVTVDPIHNAFEHHLRVIIMGGKYANAAVILEPEGLINKILADYVESLKR